MENKKIIEAVREVLSELNMGIGGTGWDSNNDVSMFHGVPSNVQSFPYENTDIPENIQNINQGFNKHSLASKNKDIYEFPMKEFHIGLDVETNKDIENKEPINMFLIGKRVIDNLSNDINYYSK